MAGGSAGTTRRIAARYEILEKLGEGGSGVVYKAIDVSLDRFVALKFLRPALLDSERAMRAFLREARVVSGLSHPHIATIYSIERHEDEHFLVLEYFPGGTLHHYLRQLRAAGRRMPMPEVIEYGTQIAGALAHAHRHEVVHRDVKPSNILFTEENVAKLSDFGLARSGAAEDTAAGMLAGTLPYMSPEQAQCRPLDHRTDIFSFGVTLFEMASGERPFDAPTAPALLDAIVHSPTPSVAAHRPDAPEALDRVISTATAKDPDERYQSMADLARGLGETGRTVAAPERLPSGARTVTLSGAGRAQRQSSQGQRRRLKWGFLALAFTVLILLTVMFRGRLSNWTRPLPAEKQIAVLPFVNIGRQAGTEAFCEGLFETITAKLTQLKQFDAALRVVAASEVRRERVASALDARRRFGVNLAITGSVHRLPDAVRLTVSLVDARTLRQLRSETIDMRLGDISALEDGVFLRTAAMLEMELAPGVRKAVQTGGTRRPSAYFLYLEGLGHLARYDRAESVDRAIVFFGDALRDDPEFALAWTGAGEACWRKYQQTKDPAWLEKARDRCSRSLALAGGLVPTHVLLGQIETGTGRYPEAIADFQRALTLDAVNVEAYRGLARAYELAGRREQAEAVYRRAIELRPRDWAGYKELGVFYYWGGRLEEAERCFRRVVELVPDSYWGYRNLGAVYCSMGRFEEAVTQTLKSIAILPTAPAYSNLGATYFLSGRFADAARAYEKALAIGAADERLIRGNLAEAYRHLPASAPKAREEYGTAMRLAERALEVNPRNTEVRASLALYAIGLGDRARALAEIGQARDAAPDNMNVLFRAALVSELAGLRTEALSALAAALRQGYPRAEVEHHPDLAELRRDTRYGETAAVPLK